MDGLFFWLNQYAWLLYIDQLQAKLKPIIKNRILEMLFYYDMIPEKGGLELVNRPDLFSCIESILTLDVNRNTCFQLLCYSALDRRGALLW